jgi:hypothetical protein
MKAKEIILLILIIVAGVFFYHAYTGKLGVFFEFDGIFSLDEFTFEEFEEFGPPLPERLKITNAHGDIEIQGINEERVTISFQKKAWRRNEAQAREAQAELKMVVLREPQQIAISTNRGGLKKRAIKTNFKIFLPQRMNVEVENSHGEVRVIKTGKASIANRHGKIIASNVLGGLTIKNSHGDIEINNIQSDCKLESEYSTMLADHVEGKMEIDHAYGKIHLENASQGVRINGPHTEVFGRNLTGPVEIQSSYEKIALFEVGPTKIAGHNSFVEVDGAREYLDIKDDYGKVKINNIQGNLFIDGKNLEVFGKKIAGQEISVRSSYRDISLSEFSGRTTVILSNGKIFLRPYPLTHPVEVRAEYSEIRFYWPQGGKYPLEARAKNGEIKWGLASELSLQEENGFSTIKAFLEEKENPSIFLSTSYGAIRIEE